MEFRLLGPFEARHAGEPVEVSLRRQERCLLAVLLLEAGRIVPIDRLADLLWDGSPPASARGVIHTYVGRLRHRLGPYGVRLDTRGDGYLAQPDQHIVDVAEFRRLVTEAIGIAEPDERVRLLDGALALWRGPLLADLAEPGLRDRLDANLQELFLTGSELRAEALLATRRTDRVVTELTPLVAEHPTRERLVACLMTALHRCGRRGDALDLYLATWRHLVDQLGLEPGADLQRLHQRILRNDPELTVPVAPAYAVRVRGHELPWTVGGHPALEFCNTYAGWGRRTPLPRGEWLRSYATLAVWAGYMDLTDDRTVTGLLTAAERDPDEAAAVLHDARVLRQRLYACLTRSGDGDAFQTVADFAGAAAKVSVFERDPDGLGRWSLSPDAGLRLPLHAAARAAADLLADPRSYTVRACPSSECGWLFLDHTGMRRWCSMAICGKAEGCDESRSRTGALPRRLL